MHQRVGTSAGAAHASMRRRAELVPDRFRVEPWLRKCRAMAKEMKTRKEFADLVMREAAPAASAQIFRACMSRDQSSADAPTGILGPGQTALISYRVLAD
jgi:hypothetical protein